MRSDDSSDSIYRAPASTTDVAPDGDDNAVFVGPRFDEYYRSRFDRFRQGASVSWHWPAFFVSALWFLYRRMWAYGLTYWFLLPIVFAVIATLASRGAGGPLDELIRFNIVYYSLYGIVGFIVVPLFANRLYYRHVNKKIGKIAAASSDDDQRRLTLARKGGTSSAALIVVLLLAVAFLGVLAAIAIPAYQDYTIRAQVSEGLNLSGGAKAAVNEYYYGERAFPADNRAAGIAPPRDINGLYVAAVTVDGGTVGIRYGRDAHPLISGQSLYMVPEARGQSVHWSCFSDTIAAKHLPAPCR